MILNAAGWLEKGVLDEADLSEIDTAINAQYPTEQFEELEFPEEIGQGGI